MTDKSKKPKGKGEARVSGELVHAPDILRDTPEDGGNFQFGGAIGRAVSGARGQLSSLLRRRGRGRGPPPGISDPRVPPGFTGGRGPFFQPPTNFPGAGGQPASGVIGRSVRGALEGAQPAPPQATFPAAGQRGGFNDQITNFATGGLVDPDDIGDWVEDSRKTTPGDTTTRRTPLPEHGTKDKASNFVQHQGPSKQ